MLVCRIEMWPGGDRAKAYDLGVVEIANIGGTAARGDYAVKLSKCARLARRKGNWKRGAVLGFPRQRLGAYDLLLRALADTIGDRNPEANEALRKALATLEREIGAEAAAPGAGASEVAALDVAGRDTARSAARARAESHFKPVQPGLFAPTQEGDKT